MSLPRLALLAFAALLPTAVAHAQIGYRAASQASAAAGQAAPAFQAAGAQVSGTGSVTPAWPAHAVGDIALLSCESAGGQPVTLTTPNGFAAVPNSPQFSGAATAGTRISVFWARATSTTMPSPVVADPGDHVYCRILTYRGAIATGNPWDVTGGGVALMDTVSVTGVTTTVANTRVVQAVSRDNDSAAAAFSAQANPTLAGLTERSDTGATSGNGGGIGVWDGVKATAGATGNTSANVTPSFNAFLTVALRPAGAAAPNFQAAGGAASGTGTVAPAWPVHAVNDVALLFCESAGGQAVTLGTPNGFAAVPNSPQFTGAGAAGTRISVFWARATSTTMAAPVTNDPGDHIHCRILTYRGVIAAGNPWDVTAGGVKNAIAVTGVTTTVPNTRVVQIVARDNDSAAAAFSAQANANLTGITERSDAGTTSGNGGGIGIWDGVMASSGATGDTTVTVSTLTHAFLTIALRPPDSVLTIAVPAGTVASDVMVASVTYRHCSGVSGGACTTTIAPPAGWTPVNTVTDQTTGGGPGGFGNRLFVYQRVATAAEPANYTWTFGGQLTHAGALGAILSFSGVDTSNPIVAEAGAQTASGNTHTAPQVDTGSIANTMLVSTHTINSSTTWTFPGGMTERVDIATPAPNNVNGLAMEVNSEPRAAAGPTGPRTATITAPAAANDTGVTHMLALRPGGINHFAISHAGSGVACLDQAITVTAHDFSHNPVSAGALLVNLSTSNGRGTWTGILAGGGTLNDAVPGDGAATYQFAVGSNSVQLAFRYANLAATSETFSFNVSGGGFSEASGTASATDDPSFTMAQAGFRFVNVTDGNTTIPLQLSGKPSDTGFNAKTLRIQAIRTDTATGSCAALFASQTRSVDLGAECGNPATCAGRQVSVNGSNIATSNDNAGAGAAAYTSVSLAFNAASEADTVIAYPDAGEISLHARYDLDPGVAGFEAIGGSNPFIVRPFGLAFPGVNHSNTAAGTLIAPAGDNFSMTVQAYQWAAGEDADNDSVPDAGVNITDNGTVPNFAATASVTPAANLPGIALGAVSRGAGCAGAATIALSGGAATAADWCYSEAGNLLLNASVTDYLAAGVNVTGASSLDGDPGGGYVGRFKPKYFAVTGAPSLANRTDMACAPASTFTYMNEELTLGFTLQARTTQGVLTQNYTGAYAKLDLSTAASLSIGARSGATNLTGRVDTSLVPAGSFANGVANLTVRTGIRRASPDNPDGPYAGTQFGIAPNDGDPDAAGGVQMGTLDLDVDGNAVSDHFAVGPATELRFGRLWLLNAYGNGASVLPVPIEAQYWNGSAFAANAADSCTALARSAIALAFGAPLAPCNTAVNAASVPFASGVGTLVLAAPGAGAQGSVLLTPNLGTAGGSYCDPASYVAAGSAPLSYLLGRWNDADNPDGDGATAYDDKPGGRAIFGRYAQPRNFIFYRENY
jgi:hypothetical protein